MSRAKWTLRADVAMACLLLSACTPNAAGEGSESHFACRTTADCERLGLGFVCDDQICTEAPVSRTDAAGPRLDASPGDSTLPDGSREDSTLPDAFGLDVRNESDSDDAVCGTPSSTPDISACPTASDHGFDAGGMPGIRGPYSITGTVTDIATDGASCNDPGAIVPGWTVRVSDSGRHLDLSGLWFPGQEPVVSMGQVVHVESIYEFRGYFAPPEAYTTVRSAEDGALIFWSATAGTLADLREPPELAVAAGGVVCVGTDPPCGSWEARALEITSGSDVDTLEPGQTGSVGDFAVTVGAFEQQTTTTSQCADWFVGAVTVAAVRR